MYDVVGDEGRCGMWGRGKGSIINADTDSKSRRRTVVKKKSSLTLHSELLLFHLAVSVPVIQELVFLVYR